MVTSKLRAIGSKRPRDSYESFFFCHRVIKINSHDTSINCETKKSREANGRYGPPFVSIHHDSGSRLASGKCTLCSWFFLIVPHCFVRVRSHLNPPGDVNRRSSAGNKLLRFEGGSSTSVESCWLNVTEMDGYFRPQDDSEKGL